MAFTLGFEIQNDGWTSQTDLATTATIFSQKR